ncbi:hypothetical protein [Pendulispora brunnea]
MAITALGQPSSSGYTTLAALLLEDEVEANAKRNEEPAREYP